jgi:hypothetical protein
MRANRGSTGGGSSDQSDGGSGKSADQLGSRTDRGNQSDEDIGSSASRGEGGGDANAPERGAADLDPIPDTDVTGTSDALGG